TEGVVQLAMLGEVRPVFRLVTRFRNYRLDESRTVAEDDTAPRIPPTRARLTFAAGDSASEFSAWEQNLGTETARLATSDFDDLAPDEWRPTGRPTMSW